MILQDSVGKVKVTQLNRRTGDIETQIHTLLEVKGQQVAEVSRPMKNSFNPGQRAKLYFKGGLDPKGEPVPRTQITVTDDVNPDLLKDIEAGDYVNVKVYQPYPNSPRTFSAVEITKCSPEEVAAIEADKAKFAVRRVEIIKG